MTVCSCLPITSRFCYRWKTEAILNVNYHTFCLLACQEPGYYEDGAFGIRIESVLLVKPIELEVCLFSFVNLSFYFCITTLHLLNYLALLSFRTTLKTEDTCVLNQLLW